MSTFQARAIARQQALQRSPHLVEDPELLNEVINDLVFEWDQEDDRAARGDQFARSPINLH